MMILHAVSSEQAIIHDIASDLLKAKLLAHAIISDTILFQTIDKDGAVGSTTQYILKGISKSLLFSTINERLRTQYGDNMPLLYSEPIIMIDAKQTDEILEKLVAV